MRRIEHDQGSPEWLEWRKGGLGGSDAAIILGVAPKYWANSTRAELLEYKSRHCGKGHERKTDTNKSEAMMRGTRLEPVARQLYREKTGNCVEPACVIHEEHAWLRASCDGLNKEGDLVLEVKCVNHNDHESAVEGRVPAHYWPQVQHLLMVTQAPRLHYWSYSEHKRFAQPQRVALVSVKPSREYLDYLFKAEETFWIDLQALIRKKKEK